MKLLEGKYFNVISSSSEGETYRYGIELLSDHDVYNGHFPGNPVSPGVCSIEMIRELAELSAGRELTLSAISQCRFITVLKPTLEEVKAGKLTIEITPQATENGLKATATISDGGENIYVTFKGEFANK